MAGYSYNGNQFSKAKRIEGIKLMKWSNVEHNEVPTNVQKVLQDHWKHYGPKTSNIGSN
jgi:hypothetical protein